MDISSEHYLSNLYRIREYSYFTRVRACCFGKRVAQEQATSSETFLRQNSETACWWVLNELPWTIYFQWTAPLKPTNALCVRKLHSDGQVFRRSIQNRCSVCQLRSSKSHTVWIPAIWFRFQSTFFSFKLVTICHFIPRNRFESFSIYESS